MSRKRYPSDISREQFEPIRELLEGARQKRRPRQVDLYDVFLHDVFCAIVGAVVLKQGSYIQLLEAFACDTKEAEPAAEIYALMNGFILAQAAALLQFRFKLLLI